MVVGEAGRRPISGWGNELEGALASSVVGGSMLDADARVFGAGRQKRVYGR